MILAAIKIAHHKQTERAQTINKQKVLSLHQCASCKSTGVVGLFIRRVIRDVASNGRLYTLRNPVSIPIATLKVWPAAKFIAKHVVWSCSLLTKPCITATRNHSGGTRIHKRCTENTGLLLNYTVAGHVRRGLLGVWCILTLNAFFVSASEIAQGLGRTQRSFTQPLPLGVFSDGG